ncbi:uncharacterized protein [Nicotiana sylvestris]|uniref:uncharacterized protein n=1 Tax=Nicotiana sylvestris TaxID=4096 RepID=UPI00388CDDB9
MVRLLTRFFLLIVCKNDNSPPSELPTGCSTSSRSVFHEDDYTHPCHPLYVHPSDVLGSSLVPVPFDGTGYGSWRRTILVALSVRNKLDFINGSSIKPPDSSPLTELEERYGQADAARVFELKKELAHISQGSIDIASYFNKIKQLWDEIDALSISRVRSCSNCGFKANYQKDDDVQKMYQFLMGLNDIYVQTRSNIFMIKPFSSVSTVYSILLSNEKQRHISTSPQFLPTSASFNVGSGIRKTAAHVEVNSADPLASMVSNMGSESVKPSNSGIVSMVPGLTQDQFSQLMMLQSHVSDDSSSTPSLMASANFADQYNGIVLFTRSLCATQAPSLKMPLVLSKLDYNLYKLLLPPVDSDIATSISFCIGNSSFVSFVCALSETNKIVKAITSVNIVDSDERHLTTDDKRPYEVLYNKLPTYSNLRAFGCLCYSTVPKPHRDKLQPRAIPCVFLGYPFGKKAYKLYDLKNKSCFVSRDVVFHEHIFPFLKCDYVSPTMTNFSFSSYFDHTNKQLSTSSHDCFSPIQPEATHPFPNPGISPTSTLPGDISLSSPGSSPSPDLPSSPHSESAFPPCNSEFDLLSRP